MLKNKKAKLKLAKIDALTATLIGAWVGLGAIGIIGGTDYAVTYFQGESYMPYTEVVQFCNDLDVNTAYITHETRENRQNTRAAFPKDGIKLNVYVDNLTEIEKSDMQRAVDDINAIFKVIRPANKFILEFNPSLGDKINKYNVDIYEMQEGETSSDHVDGFWDPNYSIPNKNGLVSFHSKIKIKRDALTYNVFVHEILHHLGLGDAYTKFDKVDTFSIMMGSNTESKHIHRNDVALLVAKYGDYSTPEKKQALIDYINSYESQQDWYKEYKEIADALADKLATSLKIDKSEIEFDLSGKTYLYEPVNFDTKCSYDMISFNKQKMTQESIGITMQSLSDHIETNYSEYGFTKYCENIDGINYFNTAIGSSIYGEVNGDLYVVSQTPPIKVGKLASEQEVEEYKNLKQKWQQNDNSSLTHDVIDALFPTIDKYIPKTDKKITSADNLKLYNEKLGEITIGSKLTIKGQEMPFEYYKGGIFVRISQFDSIFIFPKMNDDYYYISASRFGTSVKFNFSTLNQQEKETSSAQEKDIDAEI